MVNPSYTPWLRLAYIRYRGVYIDQILQTLVITSFSEALMLSFYAFFFHFGEIQHFLVRCWSSLELWFLVIFKASNQESSGKCPQSQRLLR
jgi:hypothetical protein